MNHGIVKENDVTNGAGVRVPLFVSGCTHHCPGCFNEEVQDFNFGKPFIREAQEEILKTLVPDHAEGLTFLGGEPFEPENQGVLVSPLEEVRAHYPRKGLQCYTGYTLEQDSLEDGRARCKYTNRILSMIDVLVDGRLAETIKDISLPLRGSSNKRILNLRATLENGNVKLLELNSERIQIFHRDVRRYPKYLLALQFS